MIKTDKAFYNTRTPEEYNWLMKQLEEARCLWCNGCAPTENEDIWSMYKSKSCVIVENKTISYSKFCFDWEYPKYSNLYVVRVSDLAEYKHSLNYFKQKVVKWLNQFKEQEND